MTDFVNVLLEKPIFLAPLLLIAATLVFSVLKRLVKVATIIAIAGALYALLIEYFGGGL
jgi:hypothetical protein